jgi:peptidoglycan/LPS O-acetylase OafA/YrhL
MRRLLTYGPLIYLGQRSYGAYLLHVLAIHVGYMAFDSTSTVGGLLTTCFALAVTIPAAELLYRTIQRPGMDVARRLVERLKPA